MASLKRKTEQVDNMSNSKRVKLSGSMALSKKMPVDNHHPALIQSKSQTHIHKQSQSQTETQSFFFNDIIAFLLPAGMQKARIQLFKAQIEKFGGRIMDSAMDNVTHIVVDDSMTLERLYKILKIDAPPCQTVIVKSAWLSECLRQKQLVDCASYQLCSLRTKELYNENNASAETKLRPKLKDAADAIDKHQFQRNYLTAVQKSDSESDYVHSDDEQSVSSHKEKSGSDHLPTSSTGSTLEKSPVKLPVGKWICAQSSKTPTMKLNEHITSKLEEMVKNYESTNDKWRVFGYQKAIAALRRHPKEITSWEEARSLQGVGNRLADKIWEIAQSGELRKLTEFQSSEQIQILKLFTNVWGAGPTTANAWYQQGFRTLDDLRQKANLTHQQKVGVRIYDDLLDRMPREEAAEIEKVVKDVAESIQPGIIAQACGSYRRGKSDCGDVDILLTHPDGHSEKDLFGKLIKHLKETGFLTDDLVSIEENGKQKKYLGVCKLPGPARKHRRLDIIIVPYEQYACALIYFTGSAHFNRSLRHLCKKMNMSLNEHALKTGVVRKGPEKIYEGTIVPTPTEESVFIFLGVPYRPPEERDH